MPEVRDESEDQGPDLGKTARAIGMVSASAEKIRARLAPFERKPVVGLGLAFYDRDREAAGSVLGSAVAFRLFLFFLPLLVLIVGIAGFLSGFVDPTSLDKSAGISGALAKEVNAAFHQPGLTRWVALLLGLFGTLTAGRSLGKALHASSAVIWRVTRRTRASLATVGAITGTLVGMALVAIVINRVREDFGEGVAGVSFIGAFLIYVVAWLVVSLLLPRATEDPSALLPGALAMALCFTVLQAISQLILPDRFQRASQLYGAVGFAVVTLGWFFILGRGVVIAMELDAVIYERYGSISQLVFGLPVIRILPRRSARLRRFFDLEAAPGDQQGA